MNARAAEAGIAVLGPGGVGGLLAASLRRAGERVVVVARAETSAAIRRQGLLVQSVRAGEFRAEPEAVELLDEQLEVLLVATKATTLASALERIRRLPQLVVPLLNGLDHMGMLRRRFGAGRVVAGSIAVESIQAAPGRVVQTSPFARIELAPAPAADSRAALTRLTAGLERAGVEVRHRASEAEVLWGKLVRLNALACTTSAYDAPLGEILREPTRRSALEGCVREAATVARAEGVPLAEPEAIATLAELWGAHTKLSSSLRRDLAAGRPSELDAIPGAILRAAARHQLRCATIERLVGQIERRWSPLRPAAPPRLPGSCGRAGPAAPSPPAPSAAISSPVACTAGSGSPGLLRTRCWAQRRWP